MLLEITTDDRGVIERALAEQARTFHDTCRITLYVGSETGRYHASICADLVEGAPSVLTDCGSAEAPKCASPST
jgi:hypothetical protein